MSTLVPPQTAPSRVRCILGKCWRILLYLVGGALLIVAVILYRIIFPPRSGFFYQLLCPLCPPS